MVRQRQTLFITLGILALLISGCATSGTKTASGGATSPAAIQKDKGTGPLYRDFADVLVPGEMDVVPDASFVYITSGLTAGVLTIKGHVDTDSLIAFFQNNMAKDNWKMISYFKSPKTIMLFRKETRWCAINITEGTFSTSAEIWVAPTLSDADSGLNK